MRRAMDVDASFRTAAAPQLAAMLRASRQATLELLDALAAQLGPALRVPQRDSLNLPLWEAGHIAWFQAWWIARLPAEQRHRGAEADPLAPRLPPAPVASPLDDDRLHDSSHVPHASRWQLPLPGLQATRERLRQGLDETLALLAHAPGDAAGLYFYRLVLAHEDMHQEAGLMLAQQLGLDPGPQAPRPPAAPPARPELSLPGGPLELGEDGEADAFHFDNEGGRRRVELAPFRIDARPLRQRDFLAFVEDGGYEDPRLWSPAGWAWRQARTAEGEALPRALRMPGPDGARAPMGALGAERRVFARWLPAEPEAALQQVSAFEAEAWCRWAGRRLPTEAEWLAAARLPPAAGFTWGEVWEWTAEPFSPFEGFRPHPYRDYSQPWFGDHRVLRGAAWTTPRRLRDRRMRNFYRPGRQDVIAGFRSCAP